MKIEEAANEIFKLPTHTSNSATTYAEIIRILTAVATTSRNHALASRSVTGRFCASFFGQYRIESSSGNRPYYPVVNGPGAVPYCPCKAFEFSPLERRNCKHLDRINLEACFWNETSSNYPEAPSYGHYLDKHITLRPVAIDERTVITGDSCPNCGGPVCSFTVAI